ncbi:MAG: ATP-dependent Clp protease ATP-binding subunit [Chloroflexi bacterium]|uniref:ATP-dependent Clp protease ATP-binding subunit n=1 Tax=Candidatus Flexifilum breve TaxID=3140694 RepID=UPI003134CED8|nr:ATP-dependent Clp protease ATP-binding subunit [Chloroflexota bacterium]
MGTLNPDLLSKDLHEVMNDAVALKDQYKKQVLLPEVILLALVRRKETAAARLLDTFKSGRGADLDKLDRQTITAIETRRDTNGDLDYVAKGNRSVPLSKQTIILIDDALSLANSQDQMRVDTDHMLAVMAESTISTSGLLRQHGITPKAIADVLSDSSQIIRTDGTTKDYVAGAKKGDLRAVYFRENLLRDLNNILSQSVNRHVILVGPDGVGKRTLAYSLALLMSEGKGPKNLRNLVQVDETALLDSDQKAIRAGLSQAAGGILFIPHIHRFFGGPIKAEFAKATPMIQKAFLANDPVIIGTTTEQEFAQRIVGVNAVTEHTQILRVPEPSVEETIEMLKVMKPHIEADYDLKVVEEALALAARLSKRYMTANPQPRSAEQLLHRAAAMVAMSRNQVSGKSEVADDSSLDAEDVTLAASQMTGVPVSKLGQDERVRYASMVEHLKERLIGQDTAVLAVSRAIKTARVGLKDPKRPIGAFLFLGPTGVGKTELARALAEFMFGNEDAMLPLDMSEFKDESSLNRLIGSPSGYVDSEAGGQLTERVRQQPYIIVLFDEVEKAHPRVLDILLQMIEEGRLTDGRGNPTCFSETVIILTSNLGAEYLSIPVVDENVSEQVMEEVRTFFRPEFLNRLDEIIMFNALSEEDLYTILKLLLKKETKLGEERGLKLEFTEAAMRWMLDQNDEPEFGARPLRRIIRRSVREPLADFLLRANPPAGTLVRIDANETGLHFAANVDGQEIKVATE